MRKSSSLLRSTGIPFVHVAVALASALGLAGCGTGFATQIVGHPMDPLAAEEVSAVVKALIDEDYVDGTALYPLITLQEPSKDDVLMWNPGDPVPRLAFAIVKNGPETFEAIVDTIGGKVISWEQIENVQPGLLPTVEWSLVQTIVRGDQEWQTAARKR